MFSNKTLLVIGTGNIGNRVIDYMSPFIKILTFDILVNNNSDLFQLIPQADCVTLHIPKEKKNETFSMKKIFQ